MDMGMKSSDSPHAFSPSWVARQVSSWIGQAATSSDPAIYVDIMTMIFTPLSLRNAVKYRWWRFQRTTAF